MLASCFKATHKPEFVFCVFTDCNWMVKRKFCDVKKKRICHDLQSTFSFLNCLLSGTQRLETISKFMS